MAARLLDTIRTARWLDAERARAYRLALLIVTLLVAGGWALAARGGMDANGKPLGTDFLAFWSAARLALAGAPAAAYDLARIHAAEAQGWPTDPGLASFLYPPPFLLLCLPLGLLPYFAALAAWLAATGAAYAAVVRGWLDRRAGAWPTILAFPAVLTNIGHGQNGFLTAALLGGGLGLLGKRPVLAGALLGGLVVKPQLALAVPVLVLAGGHGRTMLAGIASALLLCAAATLAFGAGIWPAFLAGGATGRAILEQGLVEPGKMVSLYAAVRVLGGGATAGYAAQALLTVAAAAAVALAARAGSIRGAAATCACAAPLMSPFFLDYDLTVVALPLAWLSGEGLRRGWRPYEKIILAAGYALPLVARPLALGLGIPVAPVVLTALLWMSLRATLATRPSTSLGTSGVPGAA